jgi:hypothetical protein
LNSRLNSQLLFLSKKINWDYRELANQVVWNIFWMDVADLIASKILNKTELHCWIYYCEYKKKLGIEWCPYCKQTHQINTDHEPGVHCTRFKVLCSMIRGQWQFMIYFRLFLKMKVHVLLPRKTQSLLYPCGQLLSICLLYCLLSNYQLQLGSESDRVNIAYGWHCFRKLLSSLATHLTINIATLFKFCIRNLKVICLLFLNRKDIFIRFEFLMSPSI